MIEPTLWFPSNLWNTLLEWCLQNRNFLFALEQTRPFIQVHFVSLEKASTMTQHSLNSKKVVTCEEFEPGKYRLLYEDRRYGRCIVNGLCSWPAGGVDGMVWSALLSVNETRQSPAEQLQSLQPASQLIATWDDPEKSVIVWKRPREEEETEGRWRNRAVHPLSEQLIENTAPWYDTRSCSCN